MSEEDLLALLEMIAQKCKANRSPYVPVVYFKHVPKYKRKPDDLRRKGLVFLYKAGKAVGISRRGFEALRQKRLDFESSFTH